MSALDWRQHVSRFRFFLLCHEFSDTNSTPEGTKDTGSAEDMRCAACVAVVVPCNSPGDPCVFVVFWSGQVEGTVTSAGKLEITDSRVPVPCDTPDDSGVIHAFLSEPDEIRAGSLVPPTAGTGKLEIAARSLALPKPEEKGQGSDCSRGKTFREVHLVFSANRALIWLRPSSNPMSLQRCQARFGTPRRSATYTFAFRRICHILERTG